MPLNTLLALAMSCTLCLGAHAQNSSRYLRSMQQEGYTLYFIKPVPFKAEGAKARLVPDFTFQHGDAAPEVVDLRFSLSSQAPVREMASLSFHADGKLLGQASGAELLFLEQAKGCWHARFSTQLPYPALLAMLRAGEGLEARFEGQGVTLSFPAGKKWRKASAVVREILMAEVGEK
ncbi:MAG: hypothetical protein KDD10_07525 [Phaeodactylibacter sp.]|nr:hypothetical protein [Phaeodactylibacter sp.]